MRRAVTVLFLGALVSGACGGKHDTPSGPAPCTDCDTAGVRPENCAAGFVFDEANRSCEPVLPAVDCADGTMAVLGKTECQPVGIAKCAEGFVSDGKGSCDPVLPSARCGLGTIAVPGDTTCAPVATCGAGTWGDIPVDGSTIYVDASYTGTSDGTSARPHRTIQAAIDAASGTALIAIAAGTYDGSLIVNKPVRLHGVCPEKVVITATTGPTIEVQTGAGAGSMKNVGVTGSGVGVQIGGASYSLEHVWIHETGGIGLVVQGLKAHKIVGTGLLIERGTGAGVGVGGASLTLDRSVVRASNAAADRTGGRGIQAQSKATLVVKRSIIEQNHETSVFVYGADATIEGTLVRDTLPQISDELFGRGLVARAYPTGKVKATLNVQGCVLERNRDKGIWLSGADATIVDTVVRDTRAQEADKQYGSGVSVSADETTNQPSKLNMLTSVIELNREGGLDVFGSEALVERSIIRGNLARESDGLFGHGIHVETDRTGMLRGTLVARSVLVAGNTDVGVFAMGADVTVEGSVIRETQPQVAHKQFGRGVAVQDDLTTGARTVLNLRSTLIEHNYESGVGVFGSDATIEGCVVRDTLPDARSAEFGLGIAADINPTTNSQPNLIVRSSLVERNHNGGILAYGAIATVEGCVVRDIGSQAADGLFGDAISAMGDGGFPAAITVTSSTVKGSARAGISIFGSSLTLARTSVTCNRIDMDLEPMGSVTPTIADGGGNACGCDGELRVCKASSSQLAPARPPEH